MSAIVARRCFVSGRVQGVYFRASTRQKAAELGLSGYASNLEDGRVEVLAVGDTHSVHMLIQWLHTGPPAAQVITVDIEELALETLGKVPVGFATK